MTGHLRLYWIRTSCKRYKYERHFYGKIIKKRYYNKSTFASYLIGYAKTLDDGKISGELGIEGYYDDILSGTNGYTKYLKYTSSNYKIPEYQNT